MDTSDAWPNWRWMIGIGTPSIMDVGVGALVDADGAPLVPFAAEDRHGAAVQIEVLGIQGECFTDAHSGAVEHGEQSAVA